MLNGKFMCLTQIKLVFQRYPVLITSMLSDHFQELETGRPNNVIHIILKSWAVSVNCNGIVGLWPIPRPRGRVFFSSLRCLKFVALHSALCCAFPRLRPDYKPWGPRQVYCGHLTIDLCNIFEAVICHHNMHADFSMFTFARVLEV